MNLFTTHKGNKLYYKVEYDLGGYNMLTGDFTERGYYLSVQRSRDEFSAFTGLESESGAVRLIMSVVSRKSKKAQQYCEDIAANVVQELSVKYGI